MTNCTIFKICKPAHVSSHPHLQLELTFLVGFLHSVSAASPSSAVSTQTMSGALIVCLLTDITNMQYAAEHAVSKSDTNEMILLKVVANGPHWNVVTDTLISFQAPHSNSLISVGTLDSSVGKVTRLRAGRVKNKCSISGRGKRLSCIPTCPQQRNGGVCHSAL